eukprot:scaffold2487_cov98-Skeletonema_dohrnii-CCMP3373.AAC.13
MDGSVSIPLLLCEEPPKAAILNKIRWAMFERRTSKEYESVGEKRRLVLPVAKVIIDSFLSFARSQLPYFSDSTIKSLSPAEASLGRNIFLESGCGAQVPRVVTNAMSASLINRDRSTVGVKFLNEARELIASLLAGSRSEEDQGGDEDQPVIMGANATSHGVITQQ